MSDPNGWPDASKPGVPKNPERSCTHRLAFPSGEHDWLWRAGLRPFWVTHTGRLVEPAELPSFRARYLGSCLTPAEVAALVAAARREGAEAMRDACARTAVSAPTNEPMGGPRTDLRSGIYAAIRALPLPDADDHLGIPAATLRALLAERDAAAADALVAGDAVRHYQEAHAQAAREVERLRAALECCVAAMDAMAADAQGDMTDADNARLWNAALDAAEAALRGGADND